MNSPRKFAAALLLTAIAGVASAQGLSRAEVKAQLMDAIHNGDMIANGETGMTERQMFPDMYPKQPVVAGKTRAEVQAELAQSIHDGTLVEGGQLALREKDLSPGMYPADPVVAGMSRAQAKANLAMAIRDGDMIANGETGQTEYQMEPQKYAAQRAIDQATMQAQQQAAPQQHVVAAH
jgi:hypothetical protein